jgi:ribose transport system permease protein
MNGVGSTAPPAVTAWRSGAAWRRRFRDQPLIPLLALLLVLVVLQLVMQPTINVPSWVSTTIKFATPLAILAACQTLTMLTAGIDLSVASVASMSAYLMATQAYSQGDLAAIAIGLGAATLVGAVNGLGVGVFRVNPLIMTIGMGLVVAGSLTVYQLATIASNPLIPGAVSWVGGGSSFGIVPNSLLLFVPLAAIILFGLRRSGYGRLLYAVGDNPTAARLAGVRLWQVLVVVYIISGFLAGLAGILYAGVTRTATLGLVDPYLLPSVAAVVIGGTSIFGGRGGYAGSIVGALILTVLGNLLVLLSIPGAVRTMLYGGMILAVAAAYTRLTEES